MIDYDLARELKDLGFPQNEGKPCDRDVCYVSTKGDSDSRCFIPTYLDLINAFGEKAFEIDMNVVTGRESHVDGKYIFTVTNFNRCDKTIPYPTIDEHGKAVDGRAIASGTSLEEALTRLWIRLNK